MFLYTFIYVFTLQRYYKFSYCPSPYYEKTYYQVRFNIWEQKKHLCFTHGWLQTKKTYTKGVENYPYPYPLVWRFFKKFDEHRISSVNACVYLAAKILISDEDPKPFLHISPKFPSFAIPASPTPE